MNTIYFKNVPGIGILYLEKILFEYDYEPIVFVCKDEAGSRYLCICDDDINNYSWIIVYVSINTLLDVLNNKITLLTPFKTTDNEIIIADRAFGEEDCTYSLSKYKDIDESELPVQDQYLDEVGGFEEYIKELSESFVLYSNIPYSVNTENTDIDSNETFGIVKTIIELCTVYEQNYELYKQIIENMEKAFSDIKFGVNTNTSIESDDLSNSEDALIIYAA